LKRYGGEGKATGVPSFVMCITDRAALHHEISGCGSRNDV